ncbi:MAG: hypothetical protein WD081_00300 [Gammaproteobacteria bacterium]
MKALMIVLAAGLAFAGAAHAGRDVPSALKPYMTQDEYRAAGLHKLNPAELAQFQAWFVRTVEGHEAPPVAAQAPTPVTPDQAADDVPRRAGRTESERLFGNEQMKNVSEITARIDGTFEGWDGPTRFRLENGQTWETVGELRFTPLAPIPNAQVTIRRGAFNSYRMQVEGYNRWIQVTRIE